MQQQLLSHAVNLFKSDRPTDIALIQIWIPTLQHFAATSTPLKASPLACCAAWLARSDSNPALIDFSRHLYSEGLREVRNALRAPDAILEDETLGACLALAVFEVIECPDKCRAAYEWHRRACVRLVQMRGAKAHRDRVGHELFLAIRLHGVRNAIKPNAQPSHSADACPTDLLRLRTTPPQLPQYTRMAHRPMGSPPERRPARPRRHPRARPRPAPKSRHASPQTALAKPPHAPHNPQPPARHRRGARTLPPNAPNSTPGPTLLGIPHRAPKPALPVPQTRRPDHPALVPRDNGLVLARRHPRRARADP